MVWELDVHDPLVTSRPRPSQRRRGVIREVELHPLGHAVGDERLQLARECCARVRPGEHEVDPIRNVIEAHLPLALEVHEIVEPE